MIVIASMVSASQPAFIASPASTVDHVLNDKRATSSDSDKKVKLVLQILVLILIVRGNCFQL